MYLKVCENGQRVHARLYECVVLVYLWGFDYEYMCVLVGGSCDGTFAPIYTHNILAATLFVRFIHATRSTLYFYCDAMSCVGRGCGDKYLCDILLVDILCYKALVDHHHNPPSHMSREFPFYRCLYLLCDWLLE